MKIPITVVLLTLYAMLSPAIAYSQDTSRVSSPSDAPSGDKAYTKVDIESSFPGGSSAWLHFLQSHLVYPNKAVRKKIEGTVILQFIVDKDGSVYDLQALTGDPLLQEAALKAMANSPRWIPAVQDGRKVKSYKKQPIIFRLQ
jgi:protein TonB